MPAGCATGLRAGQVIYIYMAKASSISELSAFVSHTHTHEHSLIQINCGEELGT